MKRYKRILVLLGVLAACCAATFALTRYEEHKEEIAVSGQTVLAVDPDTVTAVSWTVDGESLGFHKDETWQYDDDAAFPVDAEKIGEKLDVFADFAAAFTIENVEDYAQYGLDDPAATIALTAGEQSYEIKLGDFSQMDEQRYVDIGDGNVYLAASDPMDAFDVELSALVQNDTVPAFDTVSRIAFGGAENYEIANEGPGGSYSDDDIYFAGGEPLDTSLVESYLAALSGADLSTYATYNATADELEAMGMNDPELTVTVDYTDTGDDGEEVPGTFTASIARAPDDRATLETAAVGEDTGDADADAAADDTTIQDTAFWASLGLTVKYVFFVVIFVNVIAFGLAYLLTSGIRGQNFLRAGFFTPNLIGGIVLGFIWNFIFSRVIPDLSALPVIGSLPIFQQSWLSDPTMAFWSIVIVATWQQSGYMLLIYIAGFVGISKDYIEAASIDGASDLQTTWYIRMPLMVQSFVICIFLTLTSAFKVYDLNLSLTDGGPYGTTQMVAMTIFNKAFVSHQYGLGQAQAIIFFIIMLAIAIVQVLVGKSKEVES